MNFARQNPPNPPSQTLAPAKPTPSTVTSASPALPGVTTGGVGGEPLVMPHIDARTLPPHMGPMVEAIQLYDDLLIEENALLKASDAKGVSALLDRKMAATRLYQERLRAVLSETECTRALDAEQRAVIVRMVKCLEERARENTVLLKANMGAIEQVFEVINAAARKMRRREVAYSRAGTICDSYSPHSVSLAFNQSI